MKIVLLIVTFMTMALSAHAEESVPTAVQKTEAGWFSPSCPDCPKMQTPGTASLANDKGVYRPGISAKGKKKKTTPPVNRDQ